MIAPDALKSRIAAGCPHCWHSKHGGEQCGGFIATSREVSGFGPCQCHVCINDHFVFGAMNDDGTCDACVEIYLAVQRTRSKGGERMMTIERIEKMKHLVESNPDWRPETQDEFVELLELAERCTKFDGLESGRHVSRD